MASLAPSVTRPVSGAYSIDLSRGSSNNRVSSEWFSRPDDERFLSLGDLYQSVRARYQHAHTRIVRSRSIRVEAHKDAPERLLLILPGSDMPVLPANWSFGQMCSLAGAPATYLRSLPAALAGINLQHGLRKDDGEEVQLLQTDDGRTELRAATGPNYGRIWDHQLVEAVMRFAGNGTGPAGKSPACSTGRR